MYRVELLSYGGSSDQFEFFHDGKTIDSFDWFLGRPVSLDLCLVFLSVNWCTS